MKFEDLKLAYGYPLQLQTSSSDIKAQRVSCRLVGCVPGKSLMVSQPRNAGLRPGQKLVARFMVANGICLFPVSVESIVNLPMPMICLAYPPSVSFKEIRGATRVDVNLAIEATNLNSLEERRCTGKLGDVSTTGAKIELSEALGEVGEELLLQGEVNVASIQRELSIKAVVRSRIERSTKEHDAQYPAVYGIEFTETDEDKLLLLYAYVYSEMAMR